MPDIAPVELPIPISYDRQRFPQFGPQDLANWYPVSCDTGKKKMALYPAMGRKHIRYLDLNRLVFDGQPRAIFESIDYFYVIVGAKVHRYDRFYTQFTLNNSDFNQTAGSLYFAYLPTTQVNGSSTTYPTFCCLTDGINVYIIDEALGTMVTVTDTKRPPNPLFVAAFGNRFAVSSRNTTQFWLTKINLGAPFSATTVFQDSGGNAVFAQEVGIIRQMTVLHNQLYIFTDTTTGIWANIPSIIDTASFPWKKNTSFDWDYGMADPESLATGFGMIVWLAQNAEGLITFMKSTGDRPSPISTQAINVLLQRTANGVLSPFINETVNGFLYQYENTIFYRASAGKYTDTQLLDDERLNSSLEYCFNTETWGRRIELNGERNRIEKHVFFAQKHLVIVQGQPAIFEMSGDIYFNEIRNPNESNPQALTAFVAYPMRYELITPNIFENLYQEFETKFIQIDFVFGDRSFANFDGAFSNVVFIIDERSDVDAGNIIYLVAEDGHTFIIKEGSSTPILDETIYNTLFKPNVFLYYSDDGGITFEPADLREFSQLGVYSWRMRWYQLGCSRNRCYKLICVAPCPIVPLGAIQLKQIVSGGAY